jgi:hypothetical protein
MSDTPAELKALRTRWRKLRGVVDTLEELGYAGCLAADVWQELSWMEGSKFMIPVPCLACGTDVPVAQTIDGGDVQAALCGPCSRAITVNRPTPPGGLRGKPDPIGRVRDASWRRDA